MYGVVGAGGQGGEAQEEEVALGFEGPWGWGAGDGVEGGFRLEGGHCVVSGGGCYSAECACREWVSCGGCGVRTYVPRVRRERQCNGKSFRLERL